MGYYSDPKPHFDSQREDPHTSAEAPAKGNSANSVETTPVVLESAPHEMQKPPQDSLQTTPRLPTEGEPSKCKQEATGSIVTVECTNAMVGMTEPLETITDIDEGTLLGIELVVEAYGVDEGDQERNDELQLQQTNLQDEESRQRNTNVPNAYRLPLVGEWEVCASSETKNSSVDGSSKSMETESTTGAELEGCKKDINERESVDVAVECCQQLGMANGGPGRGGEPVDTLNELETLVITSIMSEEPGGGGILRVHLQGANGPGHGTDGSRGHMEMSRGQADVSRSQTDALNASNGAETDGMSDIEGAGTYLGVRDAKHVVNVMDGIGSWMDALTRPTDVLSIQMDALTTANATQSVSIPQKHAKPPDSPMETARRCPDEPNGCGSCADGWSICRDMYCIGNNMETPANASEDVSIPQNEQNQLNSPSQAMKQTRDVPNISRSHTDASSTCTALETRWKRLQMKQNV